MKRTWLRVQFQPNSNGEAIGDKAVDAECLSADANDATGVRSVTLTDRDGALTVSDPSEAKV